MTAIFDHRFRRTELLMGLLLFFLIGLSLAKWQGVALAANWLILLAPAVVALKRRNAVSLFAAIGIGLLLGLWRGGAVLNRVAVYETIEGRNVVVRGHVRDDPVYDDQGRLDFRIDKISWNGNELPGQMRIRGFSNDVRRGDTVQAAGRVLPGFGNYQAAISFAEISVSGRDPSTVETIRRRFFAAIYSVLPEPHASLGLGFLVGLRSALPENFEDQLRVVGLTHIVVASGYNLTVLVRMSRRLFARRSKYQATAASVALVLGFLAVTGASPSITRAAVVTLLSLAAWYYGRRFHPFLIILLGAALTAGFDPLYIWHDLGWWLSFLAFTGVLVLAPLITRRIWGERQPPLLMQVAVETTAAQIMAVPLIVFMFGDLSVVALVANVLVVPLIPFAMLAAFLAGLSGIFLPGLAGWLALPAQWILEYIVAVAELLSRPVWAQQSVTIGAGQMVFLYAAVLAAGIILHRKTGMKFREQPAIIE